MKETNRAILAKLIQLACNDNDIKIVYEPVQDSFVITGKHNAVGDAMALLEREFVAYSERGIEIDADNESYCRMQLDFTVLYLPMAIKRKRPDGKPQNIDLHEIRRGQLREIFELGLDSFMYKNDDKAQERMEAIEDYHERDER